MTVAMDIVAFTDGAAKGNPGPGGWGAVLLLGDAAVRELGGSGGHTTNNRMEITAALAVLEWLAEAPGQAPSSVTLVTDSTYVLRGVTEWVKNWKRRGWKTQDGGDVANRDLWERLDAAASACRHLRWRHVPGHAGYPGNERADEIASTFALQKTPPLFSGPYEGYPHDLRNMPPPGSPMRSVRKTGAAPGAKGSGGSAPKGGAAHSYVSLVDGVVTTHRTWAECERRVKGRSGARFRKTASAADEKALLAEWGARLDDPSAGR